MAYKKPGTQDVQYPTDTPLEGQLSLFDMMPPEEPPAPPPLGETGHQVMRDVIEAIREEARQAASAAGTVDSLAADYMVELHEISILNERGQNPRAIVTACRSAATKARQLLERTQDPNYGTAAERLERMAEYVAPYLIPAAKRKPGESIVFTSTGKEFVLPDQLEEYRQDNPMGAAEYERDRLQEIRNEDNEIFLANAAMLQSTIAQMLTVESNILSNPNKESSQPADLADEIRGSLDLFIKSPLYEEWAIVQEDIARLKESHQKEILEAEAKAPYLADLIPFLILQVQRYSAIPRLSNLTLMDLVEGGIDIAGNCPATTLGDIAAETLAIKKWYDSFATLAEVVDRVKDKLNKSEPVVPALLQLQSVLPKWHISPDSKVANEFSRDLVNQGEQSIAVDKRGKGNVLTYVTATLDEADCDITTSGRPFTEYDRSVMDAICSLWEFGNGSHQFTADMVYRVMNHKTETEFVSPQQRGAITKSIEKMRHIDVVLDATEEVRSFKIKDMNGNPVTSFKRRTAMLSTDVIEVVAGGNTVSAYKLIAEPILLQYSKLTKQMVTIPAKYLDVKKVDKKGNLTTVSVAATAQRIPVRDYLFRHIATMKNKKRSKGSMSTHIIFDTLYKDTGVNADTKQYAANIRKYIFQVLDHSKASGFIKGYTVLKDGKSIKGVDIIL